MTAQHSEARYLGDSRPHRPVTAGPIAVEPMQSDVFVQAVADGGGDLQPLSPETRGVVWLSEKRADELQELLDNHPGVEWVQLPWAGVDAFSEVLSGLASRTEVNRPVVTSAKGAYSEPVAEHALALVLAGLRELPEKARAASWKAERTGLSLFGRHILLFGAGGVAKAFIDLVQPFSPELSVVRRDPSQAVLGATRTLGPDQWQEHLSTVDVVVLAAAHTTHTRAVFGAEEFASLPAHAVFVNVARGALVDTEALCEALETGGIKAAGLDVTEPEPLPEGHRLFSIPSCVVTSHSADTPEMTKPLLAERVRFNVEAFVCGNPLRGVVSVEDGY